MLCLVLLFQMPELTKERQNCFCWMKENLLRWKIEPFFHYFDILTRNKRKFKQRLEKYFSFTSKGWLFLTSIFCKSCKKELSNQLLKFLHAIFFIICFRMNLKDFLCFIYWGFTAIGCRWYWSPSVYFEHEMDRDQLTRLSQRGKK